MMIRRSIRFGLVLVTLAGAAVASVACSGSSGSDNGTTTPPPPFVPVACQLVWINSVPGSDTVQDAMVIDVPIGDWTVGTHAFASGGARGFFYKHYDTSNGTWLAKAVEQSGSFALVAAATSNNGFVHFIDNTPQELVRVDSAGNAVASEGTSGTGQYFGPLSDPFSENVLLGSGSLTVVFDGTAEQLGQDESWAICRRATDPPPP